MYYFRLPIPLTKCCLRSSKLMYLAVTFFTVHLQFPGPWKISSFNAVRSSQNISRRNQYSATVKSTSFSCNIIYIFLNIKEYRCVNIIKQTGKTYIQWISPMSGYLSFTSKCLHIYTQITL